MRSIAERLAYNRRNSPKLNPLLFDEDNTLIPVIRDKINEIVSAFLDYIQVEVKILDIRLVGSNAAYNYSDTSDLDIHIVTDLSKISDPEIIARLYFDTIKKSFKESYDIKIKGIEVELYVEDVNASAQSNGIYSVSQDKWIKEPVVSVEPTSEEMDSAEEIESDILASIRNSNTLDDLNDILDKIYMVRKDALSSGGETAPGNLAFKSIRNKGILDKIKKVLRKSKEKELSLESRKYKKGGSRK